LLDSGRIRAKAEGHAIQFEEADAENLPYRDASFDTVISTFGVMFTPNQEKSASEIARVCKRGGSIGLANWTPDSFIG
jgi:ubiquinone/menaquinone biosynthesis C-methylase UbiE